MYQKSFYVLFLFHRLLITGTLVYMYYHPFHQIVIIFCLEILMVAYFIKFRPFKSELQQVIVVSDEFTIVFALIFIYFLFKNQDEMDKSAKIAFGIIGVIGISLIKNMGIILYLSFKNTYIKLRKWTHKRLNVKAKMNEIKRLRRQMKKEEEVKQSQYKELLASFFRGNLRPDQIVHQGEPSIINSMIRVERPTPISSQRSQLRFKSGSLKNIIAELKTDPNQLNIGTRKQSDDKCFSQKFLPRGRLDTIEEVDHNDESPPV